MHYFEQFIKEVKQFNLPTYQTVQLSQAVVPRLPDMLAVLLFLQWGQSTNRKRIRLPSSYLLAMLSMMRSWP